MFSSFLFYVLLVSNFAENIFSTVRILPNLECPFLSFLTNRNHHSNFHPWHGLFFPILSFWPIKCSPQLVWICAWTFLTLDILNNPILNRSATGIIKEAFSLKICFSCVSPRLNLIQFKSEMCAWMFLTLDNLNHLIWIILATRINKASFIPDISFIIKIWCLVDIKHYPTHLLDHANTSHCPTTLF